jgi:hypothetical protein
MGPRDPSMVPRRAQHHVFAGECVGPWPIAVRRLRRRTRIGQNVMGRSRADAREREKLSTTAKPNGGLVPRPDAASETAAAGCHTRPRRALRRSCSYRIAAMTRIPSPHAMEGLWRSHLRAQRRLFVGGLVNVDDLVLLYGMSDGAVGVVLVRLPELLAVLKA